MNCNKCSNQIPNDAKFCNKCGQPIGSIKVSEKDISRWKKNLVNTGNSAYAVGIITILAYIVLFIWGFYGGPYIVALKSVLIMTASSIVYIVLGQRIKISKDKNIKLYVEILLILSILLFGWIISSGGRVGLLLVILIVYLIQSEISIKKLMKVEEFYSTLTTPKYIFDTRRWVIFAICVSVLVSVSSNIESALWGALINRDAVGTIQSVTHSSKENSVKLIVKSAKEQGNFPMELDKYTTATDIVAEPNAIR